MNPAARVPDASKPSLRRRLAGRAIALAGLCAVAVTGVAAPPGAMPPAGRPATGAWGAIAARPDGYGYAFDQPSRATAERVARAQCERPGGAASPPVPSSPPGLAGAVRACEVRVWFERGCGALATGSFGEWGAAVGTDKDAAMKAALAQCDAHLPTEPCRAVASACSRP